MILIIINGTVPYRTTYVGRKILIKVFSEQTGSVENNGDKAIKFKILSLLKISCDVKV